MTEQQKQNKRQEQNIKQAEQSANKEMLQSLEGVAIPKANLMSSMEAKKLIGGLSKTCKAKEVN
jgi:hypothetical protein